MRSNDVDAGLCDPRLKKRQRATLDVMRILGLHMMRVMMMMMVMLMMMVMTMMMMMMMVMMMMTMTMMMMMKMIGHDELKAEQTRELEGIEE